MLTVRRPHGVSVKCKDCTVKGSFKLSEGYFVMDTTSEIANDTQHIIQFFEHGFVKLVAESFSAHIELETIVEPNTLKEIQIPLPQIGLPGFQIPGVAAVGPIFNPSIDLSVELSAQLDFIYGFDVTLPANSEIMIDISNVKNSSIVGFQDSTIAALPLQAGVNDISLALSAAFRPELLLGISVLDGHGTAGAGIVLNLPRVDAKISQVANVDHLCNPLNGSNNNLQNDNFTSLTNIVPKAELDLELIAQAEVRAGQFHLDDKAGYTALSKDFALPTACFSYDAAAKTYATAEPAVQTGKPGQVAKKSNAVSEIEHGIILRSLLRIVNLRDPLGLLGVCFLIFGAL